MINKIEAAYQRLLRAKWYQPFYAKFLFYTATFLPLLALMFYTLTNNFTTHVDLFFYAVLGISAIGGLMIAASSHNAQLYRLCREAKEDVIQNIRVGYAVERAANKASDTIHDLTIRTYVPSKWRFLDMETNQLWRFEDGKMKSDN